MPRAMRHPALLLFLAATVVYGVLFATSGVHDPGSADGFYSYLYARSLVFDHDLDFRNDYAVCGDPFGLGVDRGTGHLDNPGYPGPALVWVPLLAAARAVVPSPVGADAAERAGCRGRLALVPLGAAVPAGALAVVLCYLAARYVAGGAPAMFAACAVAFSGSLPQYAGIYVSSSHVYECLWASIVVWGTLRAAAGGRWTPATWTLVAFSLGALAFQRPPDAMFVLMPVALIAAAQRAARDRALALGVVAGGTALGTAALLTLYAYLYGSPLTIPQGPYLVNLRHAHPLLLLTAPQGGLLYAMPAAWLALIGIAAALLRRDLRVLAAASALVCLVCLWVSASPLDWHAKATFGARRLIVLSPLVAVFIAFASEWLVSHLAASRRDLVIGPAVAALLVSCVATLGAVAGTTRGATPVEAAPVARQSSGLAYRTVAALGDAATLPGALAYRLRFGAPLDSFGLATTDMFYRRSYRDLSWEPNVLLFDAEPLARASTGMTRRPDGLIPLASGGRVVFTAGWPFADQARVRARADSDGTLTLALRRAIGGCDLGTRDIVAGEQTVTFDIPSGCFDSGLLGLTFRTSGGSTVVVQQVTLDDRRSLPPPFPTSTHPHVSP